MDPNQLHALTLWLAREVARLHAVNASLFAVVEELRIIEPRLDSIDASSIQKEAWHQFFAKIEDWNPGLAALLDNREPEAF